MYIVISEFHFSIFRFSRDVWIRIIQEATREYLKTKRKQEQEMKKKREEVVSLSNKQKMRNRHITHSNLHSI